MDADYSFELISIVHWVPQFIEHNENFIGSVDFYIMTLYIIAEKSHFGKNYSYRAERDKIQLALKYLSYLR